MSAAEPAALGGDMKNLIDKLDEVLVEVNHISPSLSLEEIRVKSDEIMKGLIEYAKSGKYHCLKIIDKFKNSKDEESDEKLLIEYSEFNQQEKLVVKKTMTLVCRAGELMQESDLSLRHKWMEMLMSIS